MITSWSLYAIGFKSDKIIAIVAPSISVAMTNAIEIANQQQREERLYPEQEELFYTFEDIVRVEEAISKEVYVSPSIVESEGGTTLDGVSREPVG